MKLPADRNLRNAHMREALDVTENQKRCFRTVAINVDQHGCVCLQIVLKFGLMAVLWDVCLKQVMTFLLSSNNEMTMREDV